MNREETITEEIEDFDCPPAKKMRGVSKKGFITNNGERNRYDKDQLKSLEKKLNNWFERTHMPTVALSLVRDRNGEVMVKYTGAKWFEQIISDPYIKEKFVTCALEGLKKNTEDTVVRANDPASGLEHTATVLQPEFESHYFSIVKEKDVVNELSVHEKCKLIGQLVQRQGLPKRSLWIPANKPTWWPLSVEYRSPNTSPNRMRISEIDAVLTACKESLTSFSVIDSTVVEAADQSEIQHPVVEDSGPLSKKDQDLLEELKRICKSCTWKRNEADNVLHLLSTAGELSVIDDAIRSLPTHAAFEKSNDSIGKNDIHIWLRHQVPDELLSKKQPVLVIQDEACNGIYRSVSLALYQTEVYWSTIRLLSVKHGLDKLKRVMMKLKEIGSDHWQKETADDELKKEVLSTLLNGKQPTILAVVLVAVALGISINCHSLSVDHRASVTISDDLATVDLMWAVDMEGKPTARVYPLIAFNETPRPHGVCDADFACIGNNNVHPFVYPLGEQIRCRYCLQTFHAGCIFLPKDELHNWSCECHISHADLNIGTTLSNDSEQLLRFLQLYCSEVKRLITALLRRKVFSWRFNLAVNCDDRTAHTQLHVGETWPCHDLRTVSSFKYRLAHMAMVNKEFSKLDVDLRGRIVRCVLFPEVLAYIIHKECSISLFCAKRLIELIPHRIAV